MNAEKRLLQNGRPFDRLFPKAKGGTETVKRNASLADTLSLLPDVISRFSWQVRRFVREVVPTRDVRQICRQLWEFCYRYFQYREDEKGKEQIRSPARAWADRESGIDCDCFSVFLGCCLRELRIPFTFRVTKYPTENPGEDPTWSHIYVVVPHRGGEILLDPVTDTFNYEVPYLDKQDLPMDLEILNGVPGRSFDYEMLSGMGRLSPTEPKVLDRDERAAAEAGMSVEEWKARSRAEFIERNGMSPEEWAARARSEMQAQQTAQAEANEAELAKLRTELDNRGVLYPHGAGRAELLQLLRDNPPKKGSELIHTINKANPATALLRTGVLVAMQTNYFGIAGKLRWAYAPEAKARESGISTTSHGVILKVMQKLTKIFHGAGGKTANLRKAILEGKGNEDKAVSLGSLPRHLRAEDVIGWEMYAEETAGTDRSYINGLGSLGAEPVSASAALAAATAVMGTLAALLKNVKPGEGAIAESEALPEVPQVPEGGGEFLPDETGQRSTDNSPQPRKGLIGWVKDNPVKAGAVTVAGGTGIYLLIKQLAPKAKKKKPLNGTPKRRSSRRAQAARTLDLTHIK